MNFYDTIAALSTPSGKGGVAVIRISGAEAVDIAEKVFFPKNKKKISELAPNVMTYGDIKSGGETIDDGLTVVFKAPKSFTGEDTVEINCHGGIFLTQKVLSAVFAAGARPAEAGEFTRRAYVNGKMGLSRAEALGSLLEAKSDEQLRLARGALNGRIENACGEIYKGLTNVLAQVYAKVDYPEEDLADMSTDEMKTELSALLERISALKATYRTGHAIVEGVRTVICGKPNVGKSSLYNCLVGRDAAIVTEHKGTTRDLLFETVSCGKVTLRLCDTAGIRETSDAVEQIGVERARAEMENAELVLAVFDNSRPLDDEDLEILDDIKQISGAKIAVINKNDENSMIDYDKISSSFDTVVKICAKNSYNIEELQKAVEILYINEGIDTKRDAVLMNARQNASLERTERHIGLAIEALELGMSADVAGVDVELAMAALSEIDGREVGEDIVSEIFSHFCVGK